MTSGVEQHGQPRRLFVALVAAVLALVVGVGVGVDAHASSSGGQVAGTRVATHELLAGPVVAASGDVLAGEGRRTTTPAADVAIGSRVAPQATPTTTGGCDGEAWVIGESWEGRTQWAARAFSARAWDGPPRGSSHLETCAANEAWLRGVIARGKRIIDIGIDSGRQGNRSPYYELERRVIAETGYPVEERWWFPSARPYPGIREGACP